MKLCNWWFKKSSDSSWTQLKDSGKTSTEIHVDLIENGIIPDPFIDQNEKLVQWVGEQDWDYRSSFEVSDFKKQVLLKFNGLDTFASIYLNGTKIFENDNMFEIKEIDISKHVREKNELVLCFQSALLKAREISRSEYNSYVPKGFNGEGNRNLIRKAQYHYGWDWGPILMTCGPYRDIELFIVEELHISDCYIYPTFEETLQSAMLNLEFSSSGDGEIEMDILDPTGELVVHDSITCKTNNKLTYKIDAVKLWYPNGIGLQPLYRLVLKSSKGNNLIDKKFGIRKIELVQDLLQSEPGSSFYFKVNDIAIYSSGVNWIPAHSFQTKLTYEDYENWLSLVKEGHFNMVRIWGGGFYEQDLFYELCDEMGLMIWHDFMFACGQYPGDDNFVALVRKEVSSQLKRLRNHCSIVLWCGNNEDYQVLEQLNLKQDDFNPVLNETTFPAQILYEQELPLLVDEYLHGQVPYHRGSPYGGSQTIDTTVGDLHQWNVWHGTQEKYQDWDKLQGRFVSEFGMLSYANFNTLKQYITDETELYPQSETVCFHNKADGSERRVGLYMSENFKMGDGSLRQWCYLTQLLQSDCLIYLIRYWKRNWSKERLQSGYIVWQINDCWPVNSWLIVDFEKRPKLAYYSIKRENAAITVGCKRLKYDIDDKPWEKDMNDDTHQYGEIVYGVDLWCCNLSLDELPNYKFFWKLINVLDGKVIDHQEFTFNGSLNQTTIIPNKIRFHNKSALIYVLLYNDQGIKIYSAVDWPQPVKFLKFAKDVKITITSRDNELIITSDKPVKGLELYCEANENLKFLDNCIDLIPDEKIHVKVVGMNENDKILYRYYDMSYN